MVRNPGEQPRDIDDEIKILSIQDEPEVKILSEFDYETERKKIMDDHEARHKEFRKTAAGLFGEGKDEFGSETCMETIKEYNRKKMKDKNYTPTFLEEEALRIMKEDSKISKKLSEKLDVLEKRKEK